MKRWIMEVRAWIMEIQAWIMDVESSGYPKILLKACEKSVVVRWGKYFVLEDGKLQTFATI